MAPTIIPSSQCVAGFLIIFAHFDLFSSVMAKSKRRFRESASSYSLLSNLTSKVRDLARLALRKVESPLNSRRSIELHNKEVEAVCGEASSSIARVKKSWTTITGHGQNEYVERRRRNDLLRTAQSSTTSTAIETQPFAKNPVPPSKLPSTTRTPRIRIRKESTPPRPLPSDGNEYTPSSAIKHIVSHHKKMQGRIITSMENAGQVPVSARQLQRLSKRKRDENIDAPFTWFSPGRTPFATGPVLKKRLMDKATSTADTVNKATLNEVLQDIVTEERGPLATFSGRTLRNYCSYMKSSFDVIPKVRYKSITRIESEKSIRAVIAYLHTVATTHYSVNTDKNATDPARLKFATIGSQELYAWLCKMYDGAALKCILNDMNLSTDDTTVLACEIKNDKAEQWFLLTDPDVDTGSRSLYSSQQSSATSSFRSGLTIRHTFTMGNSGRLAPICGQVLHLTERELPTSLCPDGILFVTFPGLCIGASVDGRIKNPGYIIFARQGVSEHLIFIKICSLNTYSPY